MTTAVWKSRLSDIPIKDLTDAHLLNIIAYLRHHAPGNKGDYEWSLLQADVRGQHACDAVDELLHESQDPENDSYTCEAFLANHYPYWELLAEAFSRGLPVPPFDEDAAQEAVSVRLCYYLSKKYDEKGHRR